MCKNIKNQLSKGFPSKRYNDHVLIQITCSITCNFKKMKQISCDLIKLGGYKEVDTEYRPLEIRVIIIQKLRKMILKNLK